MQNEEAEELMRKVEKEEEAAAMVNPGKQCFHLCIINLVIGTLYCAKVWYREYLSISLLHVWWCYNIFHTLSLMCDR